MRAALSTFSAIAVMFFAVTSRAETCVRPTDAAGYGGFKYDTAPTQTFDTPHVRVFYTVTGPHAVRPATTRADNVPDDVALVGQTTEDALVRYAQMGYRAPLSDADATCGSNGGDGRLDVYLVHFPAADGSTMAERCAKQGNVFTCSAFILAEANLAAHYASAEIGARTVLPHEAFHAVQDAYDAEMDRYFAEGTAQWAAKALDPTLKDLEKNLPAFFKGSGRAIDSPIGDVTGSYLYGAAIWPLFLGQHYDANLIRESFEREATSGPPSLGAVGSALEGRGTSLKDAWSTFWSWNAATGKRADVSGYPDAASYPLLAVTELTDTVTTLTSGSMSHVYHVAPSVRSVAAFASTDDVHSGVVLPIENGHVVLARAMPLPATIETEALVIVTSVSKTLADSPYTLNVTEAKAPVPDPPAFAPADTTPNEDEGCAIGVPRGFAGGAERLVLFSAFTLALVLRRASRHKRSLAHLFRSSVNRSSRKDLS